jgi:hypothetical protein
VTVYPDFAVIRESRAVEAAQGVQEVVLPEVPTSAQATSIRFVWPEGSGIETVEQDLEYDLVSPAQLLRKYTGRRLELTLRDGARREGELLYADESAFILRPAGGAALSLLSRFDNVREVGFPEPPERLLLRPSLVCKMDARKAGRTGFELSYVAKNFSWRADYVAVLDAADRTVELTSWVTLNNGSGTAYRAARLRLATPGGEHVYDVPRPTSLENNQLKQVRLFPTVGGVKVEKSYLVRPAEPGRSERKEPVAIHLRFRNTRDNRLGFALPAGQVRVLKADAGGAVEFVGEAHLDHVPENEEAGLTVGQAFDLVAERKSAEVRRPSPALTEYVEELVLRNRKGQPVEARVILDFGENSEITVVPAGAKQARRDAVSWEGAVQVPPGNDGVTLGYTVRVTRSKKD